MSWTRCRTEMFFSDRPTWSKTFPSKTGYVWVKIHGFSVCPKSLGALAISLGHQRAHLSRHFPWFSWRIWQRRPLQAEQFGETLLGSGDPGGLTSIGWINKVRCMRSENCKKLRRTSVSDGEIWHLHLGFFPYRSGFFWDPFRWLTITQGKERCWGGTMRWQKKRIDTYSVF